MIFHCCSYTAGFIVKCQVQKRIVSSGFTRIENIIYPIRKQSVKFFSSNSATSGSLDNGISEKLPFFRVFYNDIFEVPLPPNHRFPMKKYRRVRKLVQRWVNELSSHEQEKVHLEFVPSPLATVDELMTTHDEEYVNRYLLGNQSDDEIRAVGFPWSEAGVNRSLSSVGGTIAAACSVCEEWMVRKNAELPIPPWAAHVAGGTHHAFYDYGEGFCVFSDIAVAANVVLERYPEIKKILIIDLDVHQGNGNAVLFQGRDEVDTFSVHCDANYFSEKQHSDLDIEIPAGCGDQTYLMTLKHWLKRIKNESGPYDLIFFQAGVDVLECDRLGRLNLSEKGVERRNRMVYDFAKDLGVPLVITMGGGYPRRDDWSVILRTHANVYFQAHQYLAEVYCASEMSESKVDITSG